MARHQHVRYMNSAVPAAALDDQPVGDQPGNGGLRSLDFPPEHPAIAVGVERHTPGEIEDSDVEGAVETAIGSRVELQIAGTRLMRLGPRRTENAEHAQRRAHVSEPTRDARHDDCPDRNSWSTTMSS